MTFEEMRKLNEETAAHIAALTALEPILAATVADIRENGAAIRELLESTRNAVFPLNELLIKIKLRALAQHRSQLEHPSGQPILPDNLLAPARRKFEVFAAS